MSRGKYSRGISAVCHFVGRWRVLRTIDDCSLVLSAIVADTRLHRAQCRPTSQPASQPAAAAAHRRLPWYIRCQRRRNVACRVAMRPRSLLISGRRQTKHRLPTVVVVVLEHRRQRQIPTYTEQLHNGALQTPPTTRRVSRLSVRRPPGAGRNRYRTTRVLARVLHCGKANAVASRRYWAYRKVPFTPSACTSVYVRRRT